MQRCREQLWQELGRLKPVSPSLGLMLETTSRRLFETRGEAHFGSPDKDPAIRSNTSVCLKIVDPAITSLSVDAQWAFVKDLVALI